jgi:hypothetical protein
MMNERRRLLSPWLLSVASIASLAVCAPDGGEPRTCEAKAEQQPDCFPDDVLAECRQVEAICPHYVLTRDSCPPASFDCMFTDERGLFLQTPTKACEEATDCEVYAQSALSPAPHPDDIQQRQGGPCWFSEQSARECDRYCPFREGQLHDALVAAEQDPGPCDAD